MEKFPQRLTAVVILVLFALITYFLWDYFRDRSIEEQLAEIILDEDRRELTERLEKYLQAEDPDVRGRAALAVGRIGARGSGALLVDMIYDANLDVAATAAFALGLTEERGYASQLVDLANDLPSAVAFRVVEAVGRLADSTMYDVARQLVEMLLHPSPEVREAACMAIYRAGAKSKAPDLLTFVAGEEDRPVRKAVLYTLAQFGYEEAAPLFEEYLADSDPFARATAVRGLGRSKAASAEHYLAIAMNDADHGVVAGAIAQLGGF
ncbi:MAG: HEAT repeat domain-containing protein, partial [candidate division Zixibacteria bacterium]|nr:HEAT repeat domain-containing protein [candidate division Zixibacteria bacterium]